MASSSKLELYPNYPISGDMAEHIYVQMLDYLLELIKIIGPLVPASNPSENE